MKGCPNYEQGQLIL